jgi:hypothetical protein
VQLGQLVQNPETVFVEEHLDTWLTRLDAIRQAGMRIRVFVSSPSELRRERRLVAETCRQLSLTLPVHMEALLWEGGGPNNPEAAPFPPEITGLGAQAVIDDHVWNRLGGYDVYVGLLWRRMGTPTGKWRSGTEAEFRYAADQQAASQRPRHILLYFKDTSARQPADPAVDDFYREVRASGLVHQRFRDTEQFRRAIYSHLAAIAHQELARP